MAGNLTQEYPADFMQLWDGCSHQDCLPKCWHGLGEGHCERLEKAFTEYQDAMECTDNGRNTGGKSYLRLHRT